MKSISKSFQLNTKQFNCNGSAIYADYKVVLVNVIMLKHMCFVTLGKAQFKVRVEIEDEKHIYSIPAKHSWHYQSSIVMVVRYILNTK